MMSAGLLMAGARRSGVATRDGARPSGELRTVGQAAAVVAALIAFCASGGFAQVVRAERAVPVASAPRANPAERGWMGVGVDVTVRERRGGPPEVQVHIVRTVDGSPAAAAGIVPGHVIRAIDGEPLTMERWRAFTENLRPGVEVRLALDRAGRRREVVILTTAPRPSLPPVPVGLTARLDSVRTSFRTQLESARGVWATRDYVTNLIAGDSLERVSTRILDQVRRNAVSYSVRTGSNANFVASSGQAGNRFAVVWNTDGALPFEYLMLQSPEADSVKTAIIHLRGELSEVTEARHAREQEIRVIMDLRARELGDNDAQLLRLRSDNERVQDELERLAVRLAEIGSNERESRMRVPAIGELEVRVRPLTARLVGQNFVGGAQFSDLNPQLGEYFGTDYGVLVIQVLGGTPCDEAGLRPGDVVTHVGDTDVDSVETFRRALNRVYARGRHAELTLMRRGERVAVTLSR